MWPVHLFLEFIFSLSMTGYWFNNIRLHQIGKKFRSAWTFQLKKFHNCTSSKYSIKAKLLKESMDMNRRFYCEIAAFCGKHAFNIHFCVLNVHFHTLNVHFFFVQKSTYVKIPVVELVFLAQKQISEKYLKIFCSFMDTSAASFSYQSRAAVSSTCKSTV